MQFRFLLFPFVLLASPLSSFAQVLSQSNPLQNTLEKSSPLDIDLISASLNGDRPRIRKLLEAGARLNARDMLDVVSGETALHKAVQNGDRLTAHLLLDAGANMDSQDDRGETPLLTSVFLGDHEVVQTLLKFHANTNLPARNGLTPLLLAAERGDVSTVESLLQAGAKVDVISSGYTPLMRVARGKSLAHQKIARLLLSARANVNRATSQGTTALMLACASGNDGMVQLLLESGAKPELKRKDGREVLWFGLLPGGLSDQTIRLLIDAGADVNASYNAAIEWSMGIDGPIFAAAHSGRVSVMRMLLEHGTNVRQINSLGFSVEELIRHSFINLQNADENTKQSLRREMLQLLTAQTDLLSISDFLKTRKNSNQGTASDDEIREGLRLGIGEGVWIFYLLDGLSRAGRSSGPAIIGFKNGSQIAQLVERLQQSNKPIPPGVGLWLCKYAFEFKNESLLQICRKYQWKNPYAFLSYEPNPRDEEKNKPFLEAALESGFPRDKVYVGAWGPRNAKDLLFLGVDPDSRGFSYFVNDRGITSLARSVSENRADLAWILLDTGANRELYSNGLTAYCYAFFVATDGKVPRESLRVLESRGANTDCKIHGLSILFYSLISKKHSHEAYIHALGKIDSAADLWIAISRKDPRVDSLVEKTDHIHYEHVKQAYAVGNLVLAQKLALRCRDTDEGLLVKASRDGNLKLVQFLLKRGFFADPRENDAPQYNPDRRSAVAIAADQKELSIVEELLRAGADVNRIDQRGRSLLEILGSKDPTKHSEIKNLLKKFHLLPDAPSHL